MRKLFLTATAITTISPIGIIACARPNDNIQGGNGLFTEYVRAHDLALSLGVEPQWHARSDLGSTHDLTNEGYLDEFSQKTINGKRYNGADREYFASLGIKLFVARKIDDTKGKLTDIKNIYPVLNSDFDSWQNELRRIASKFDKEWPKNNYYAGRANKVIENFEKRNKILQNKINTEFVNSKTIILVRGDDDNTKVFSGIIPKEHISPLYSSTKLVFPSPDQNKLDYKGSGTIPPRPYLIAGKDATTPNNDLVEAFKNKADYLVYLQTPKSTLTKSAIQNNNQLKEMLKTNGKIIAAKYDYWYLPYRGAAIGANVSIDNIYKDLLNESVDSNWKLDFKNNKK